MGERATRYDAGSIRWEERDLRLLPWIFGQYLIRLDHLAELAGRWPGKETKEPGRLGEPTVRGLVRRWRLAGAVESRTLLAGQPPWCWVTPRGQTLMGLEGRFWEPTIRGLGGLEHRYYVNQVRLWLEGAHPAAQWTSERHLLQQKGARTKGVHLGHMPDADVRIGERTIAVEVELTAKTEERWQDIFAELGSRYDQVWYFAPQRLLRDLGQAIGLLSPGARAKVSLSQLNEAAYRRGPARP